MKSGLLYMCTNSGLYSDKVPLLSFPLGISIVIRLLSCFSQPWSFPIMKELRYACHGDGDPIGCSNFAIEKDDHGTLREKGVLCISSSHDEYHYQDESKPRISMLSTWSKQFDRAFANDLYMRYMIYSTKQQTFICHLSCSSIQRPVDKSWWFSRLFITTLSSPKYTAFSRSSFVCRMSSAMSWSSSIYHVDWFYQEDEMRRWWIQTLVTLLRKPIYLDDGVEQLAQHKQNYWHLAMINYVLQHYLQGSNLSMSRHGCDIYH